MIIKRQKRALIRPSIMPLKTTPATLFINFLFSFFMVSPLCIFKTVINLIITFNIYIVKNQTFSNVYNSIPYHLKYLYVLEW